MKRPLKIFLRVVAVLLILLIAGFAFLYITFRPDEHGRIVPWGESIDMSVLPEFHKSLKSSQEVVIFEGLPHQGWERELLKSEIRSKETLKLHGFHFYSRQLEPSVDDNRALVGALSADGGIVEWAGMKMCGGYHPDYAVRWTDSTGITFEALICFGCHEIKLYGDGLQLYADLNDDIYRSLKEILAGYERQRPNKKQTDNKTSILTPDTSRVEIFMTVQPSTPQSERALGQA
jgi:hypothetical protein